MFDVLKITLVFASILALLRLKWNIGYVLLTASGLLSLLYLMPPRTIALTVQTTVSDSTTIQLFFALTLIRSLEMILREQHILARMMQASRAILRKKKAVIISMPLLIGMLPSLGGAYFSAPMVAESTKGLKMSPEEKGFINYWYRHPWEYILPLYPGVILASAITSLQLRSLMVANAPYALLVLITGFLFSMRTVQGSFRSGQPLPAHALDAPADSSTSARTADGHLLWSFIPIILVLLFVVVLHIELHYTLGVIITGLLIGYRYKIKDIFRALRYGFALDVAVLIFGTMLFKFTMDASGAVVNLSNYFTEKGIPLVPVIFALPFLTGLLTGLTVGFVGGTFPLVIHLAGGVHLDQITFAFASGFLGVLLSPVHLCLVLTREYFKADLWGIYKRVIPASIIIMAAALGRYLIL